MECPGGLPRQEGTREPIDDEELIARLRAAVRRYRQIGGPPRLELIVDGMRVVIEDQHLGWNWPASDPE